MKFFLLNLIFLPIASANVQVSIDNDTKNFLFSHTILISKSKEAVIEKIESFENRCNEKNKRRRLVLDKKAKCPIHNENLIEAIKITNFDKIKAKKNFPHIKYIVWRHILNKGEYQHYDAISKHLSKNKEIIEHKIISKSEIEKILEKPFKTKTSFDQIHGIYEITQLNKNQTEVKYKYSAETKSWFLTRDILESTIKNKIKEGVISNLTQLKKIIENP